MTSKLDYTTKQDLCLELKILLDRWIMLQEKQAFTGTEWRRMKARIDEIERLLDDGNVR